MATPRVSPPRILPEAAPAPKPPQGSAGSIDAHRQCGFVLGAEVDLVVACLHAEGDVAAASAGAKYRSQRTASALGMWSRSWLARLQALHAVQWGSYSAAIPLVRAAADYLAAEAALLGDDAAEWQAWLESGGIAQAPADHATEYGLHAFRSAETLARRPALGEIYRAASDLSMPHFGATLLLAGSDSTPERVLMTFGDRDFHLALAELVLGWLHGLAVEQGAVLGESDGAFAPDADGRLARTSAEALVSMSRRDRCRMEVVEREGMQRYLVHNWRRAPGSAAKRILL